MTKILKTMPFGSAGGEWQNRVKPVESLDRALFIDTEDRRVRWRLNVQANDVDGFLFKLRIVAGRITPRRMRLNPEMAPDPADAGLAKAQFFGQPIAAPMGRTVRGTLTGSLQDSRLNFRGTRPALTTPIARIKPRQTLLLKALLPLPNILVAA